MKARELGWFTSMKQREWMTNPEKGPELWDKGNGCQKLDEIRTLLQNLLSRNLLGGSALSSESFLFVAFLRGKQSVVLASVSIYPFGGSSAKTLNRCFLPNRLQANSSLSLSFVLYICGIKVEIYWSFPRWFICQKCVFSLYRIVILNTVIQITWLVWRQYEN